MKAKWILSMALAAAVSAPAWAFVIEQAPVPNVDTTGATFIQLVQRPEVDGGRIAWGTDIRAPLNRGGAWVYDTNTSAFTNYGLIGSIGRTSINWAPWANRIGIAGTYMTSGSHIEGAGNTVNVGGVTGLGADGTGGTDVEVDSSSTFGGDHHFTTVTSSGDAFWQGFATGNGMRLMHANLNNPGVVTQISDGGGEFGGMPYAAKNGDRVVWLKTTNTVLEAYDISDATVYEIWDAATNAVFNTHQGARRTRLSNEGNWAVFNNRLIGGVDNASDIFIGDLTDISNPVWTNLTNDALQNRDDPVIQMISADEALVVYGTRESAASPWYIEGFIVSGLASNAPVAGDAFVIAKGANNRHYPSTDGNVIAWLNSSAGVVEYTYIPEPASLALLALGGLALARRRR